MSFDYPNKAMEAQIVAKEAGVDLELAQLLARLASHIRQLKDHDLEESASTRLLIYAATLIKSGIAVSDACRAAIAEPLSDDIEVVEALMQVMNAQLGDD